jgi:uncharacterized cupredoxin-like copper-binding protein
MREVVMIASRKFALVGLAVAMSVSACGGSDDGAESADTGADVQTLTVVSRDTLKFDPPTLDATAGEIHIVHDNEGSTVHSFVLDGQDFKLTDSGDGNITLGAGEYPYYCDVPGHRDGGMEGVLTVTP